MPGQNPRIQRENMQTPDRFGIEPMTFLLCGNSARHCTKKIVKLYIFLKLHGNFDGVLNVSDRHANDLQLNFSRKQMRAKLTVHLI